MPGRGTQQNLRNFEAISLRLEPLAMVNAEMLLATKSWAERTRSALSLSGGFGQKLTWREGLLLADTVDLVAVFLGSSIFSASSIF
jgi:hypothetical protein